MLDLKSIVCAGFGCIMHLQAMAEEVIFFLNRFLKIPLHLVIGYNKSSDLSCGQKDWRKVQDSTKIYQARADRNSQVKQ